MESHCIGISASYIMDGKKWIADFGTSEVSPVIMTVTYFFIILSLFYEKNFVV